MRGSYVEVLLHNIRHNIRLTRGLIGPDVKMLLVVKADAYGHGMVRVSQLAQSEGVDWLGVGTAEEGQTLRAAGINLPILIFSPLSYSGMLAAARAKLTVPIVGMDSLRLAEQAARESGKPIHCHLKIDTGMNRVGMRSAEEIGAVLRALKASDHVLLGGAFTHFSDADNPDPAYTQMQMDRFIRFTEPLPKGIIRHAAATAGLLSYPESRLDMVRLGIGAYGYPPVATDLPFKPCLRILARVAFIKEIAAGDCVGYGRGFIADQPMRIATVAIGYGDGYPRALSGKGRVLIRGKSCPILSRVCMDQVMVDVSQVPGISVGDQAVLLGQDGDQRIDAEELARLCGTISYEILLSPRPRLPRYFRDDKEE